MHSQFRVGDHYVCVPTATISRDEVTTHVDRMALRVLQHLARSDGAPVSRQEILDVVWEGRIVSEGTLTSAISRLRRALGDSTATPRFIETLPGFGYRLIAPASFGESLRAGEEPSESEPLGGMYRSRSLSLFGLTWRRLNQPAQFLVAALLGVGIYLGVVCQLIY